MRRRCSHCVENRVHREPDLMTSKERPCTMEDLLGMLDRLRAPRLQGITLKDIQPAASRPCPRYANDAVEPLRLPLQTREAVLWRLAENCYTRWHKASLPIFEDDYFTYRLSRDLAEAGRALDLPKIYAVLVRRFGPSSQYKDEWKEGFKFPLLIELEPQGKTIFYSLTVAQWKAGLEIRFRRQHRGVEHLDRHVYQQPFDAELSRAQLNQCAGFIVELCSVVYYATPEAFVFDFHLAVPAAQIAFGCLHGQFYEWHARNEADFAKHSQQSGHCARRR